MSLRSRRSLEMVSPLLARALLAAFPATAAFAAAADPVRFSTDPPGAHVCVQSKGVFQCSGVTPTALDVGLVTQNESRRYFFKRLGYRTESVLVTAKDPSIHVRLTPAEIFLDPEKHRDAGLRESQRRVNQALHQRIYAASSAFAGIDAEIVGQITVTRSESRTIAQVGMLVTNALRRREIGAASRSVGGREAALARAVLLGEASRIHALVHDAVRAVPGIDAIALSVDYAKASAVLSEENIQFLRTYVTGRSITYTSGGKRELVTEYTTVRHSSEVTKIVDEIGIRTVVVITARDTYSPPAAPPEDVDSILRSSTVHLNDNRKVEFTQIRID